MDKPIPAVVSQAPAPTTWIANNDPIVQGLCQQFKTLYRKERKTLAAFGKLLLDIRDNPNLKTVDADGKEVEATTNMTAAERTFGSICEELGVPVRTGYHYIATYISTTKYPQEIQDAAVVAGLNLALDHVVAKYAELEKAGLPAKPTPYEVKGIIADLETAKPKKPDRDDEAEPISHVDLVKGLVRFIKRAMKSMTPTQVVSAVAESMKDAKLPEAQHKPTLDAALDMIDKGLGIDTRSIPADDRADAAGA